MTEKDRLEILLKAYDLERQDERNFWATIPTLTSTALGVIVTITFVADPASWQVWIFSPFFAIAMLVYYAYQGAVGSLRRRYMEALEREICGEEKISVDEGVAEAPIRLLAYNRYTWALSSKYGALGGHAVGQATFTIVNILPVLLVATVIIRSPYKIPKEYEPVACILLAVSVFLLVLIVGGWFYLMSEDSRRTVWKLSDGKESGSGQK
ncbi:hypothetical protein [Saccharothrix variisporea]|uniref:hypothetical protein n=1 Tax=Saccharothrix variisporea TaxID=543527 RepID=UPI0011C3F3B0|nr:hypothetical protein [Saccharothrix variisporea]